MTMPRRCPSIAASIIAIGAKNSSNIGWSTSRFSKRANVCSQYGSANASGEPIHSHSERHWRGLSSTSRIHPSLVRIVGYSESCALRRRRASMPAFAIADALTIDHVSTWITASNADRSSSWPRSVTRRCQSAASVASAPITPTASDGIEPGHRSGSRLLRPAAASHPLIASTTSSVAV